MNFEHTGIPDNAKKEVHIMNGVSQTDTGMTSTAVLLAVLTLHAVSTRVHNTVLGKGKWNWPLKKSGVVSIGHA